MYITVAKLYKLLFGYSFFLIIINSPPTLLGTPF